MSDSLAVLHGPYKRPRLGGREFADGIYRAADFDRWRGRTYRYALARRWAGGPAAVFIGLNPSVADDSGDDPTVRRCIGFARGWGMGALVMVNLYGLVATDPRQLRKMPTITDAIGPGNDALLLEACQLAGIVVAAWGGSGPRVERGEWVVAMLEEHGIEAHCLGRTKGGDPRHPLYLAKTTGLEPLLAGRREATP